jgi:hypothetical protein
MAGKNRPAQIIKLLFALLAAITPAFLMAMILAALSDLVGITVGTQDPVGPPQAANFLVTLRVVYQMVDVQHRALFPGSLLAKV